MIKNKIEKLRKVEFFDVYGISLYEMREDRTLSNKYLLSLLLPIAKKYIEITLYALRSELRYFLSGGARWEYNGWQGIRYQRNENRVRIFNKKILEKNRIKNWRLSRKKLSLDKIIILFSKGDWIDGYGGEAWKNISIACKTLELEIYNNNNNITKICQAIDRLNDLEHNNAFYLWNYTSFNLREALDYKSEKNKTYIFSHCSDAVRELEKF